mmetsp:Transcript_8148/g.23150  ORF Transcript_8148/g.23150 Transcript_8148/m.23150 type:complete len:209 (-) Transcript_8148:1885-2511(-)
MFSALTLRLCLDSAIFRVKAERSWVANWSALSCFSMPLHFASRARFSWAAAVRTPARVSWCSSSWVASRVRSSSIVSSRGDMASTASCSSSRTLCMWRLRVLICLSLPANRVARVTSRVWRACSASRARRSARWTSSILTLSSAWVSVSSRRTRVSSATTSSTRLSPSSWFCCREDGSRRMCSRSRDKRALASRRTRRDRSCSAEDRA